MIASWADPFQPTSTNYEFEIGINSSKHILTGVVLSTPDIAGSDFGTLEFTRLPLIAFIQSCDDMNKTLYFTVKQ